MDRRTFIKISGIAMAVSVTPWLSGCTSYSQWTGTLATPQILGAFCNKEELLAIGNAYSAAYPNEQDQSTLETEILGDHVPTSDKTLAQFIATKISREFASGDLVVVKGWVLSKTEARQIALFSLLNL